MRLFDKFLVYEGKRYSIYFHAENGCLSKFYDYFENCDDITQASLLYLVKRLGDAGKIYDTTKFRIEDSQNKIYALKPKQDRFFCFFFTGKTVIITSAYRKQKRKLNRKKLKKAIDICNKYITG